VSDSHPVNGAAASDPAAGGPGPTDMGTDQLRRQVEELRGELTRVQRERDEYRAAAYSMLRHIHPYVPPTEEELRDMLHGPRGQPIEEVIAEFEQLLPRDQGGTDGG
jgi:hypothetical protein